MSQTHILSKFGGAFGLREMVQTEFMECLACLLAAQLHNQVSTAATEYLSVASGLCQDLLGNGFAAPFGAACFLRPARAATW